MKKLQFIFICIAVVGLMTIPALSPAVAADYPSRPITLVVNYPPGGAHDLIARALQAPLGAAMGTSVVVENRGGGSTKIGTTSVKQAKPDGYTIVIQSSSAWMRYYSSGVYDYKPWVELTPIAAVCLWPDHVVEVRVESPFKTWQDLVAAAKKNPGKVTCGGPGTGGGLWSGYKQVTTAAGIDVRWVPFKGGKPAQTAMLGGHVDFMMNSPGQAASMVKAGKSRVLTISSKGRYFAFPDAPTFTELGIGESSYGYLAIYAPPATPKPIVSALVAGIAKATKDPKYVDLVQNKYVGDPKYYDNKELVEADRKLEQKKVKK